MTEKEMEAPHPPEPWRLRGHDMGVDILGKENFFITIIPWSAQKGDPADKNAERIRDCVNAMSGITDPEGFMREVKEALRLQAIMIGDLIIAKNEPGYSPGPNTAERALNAGASPAVAALLSQMEAREG